MRERALLLDCEGDSLVAILSLPDGPARADVGLLVVVGGPQYRAGSHRMFTQLCRGVAARGRPAMRFDVRGMGDSTGAQRSFEDIEEDIRSAVNGFLEHADGLSRVVLWGLCDGASASCLYDAADERVASVVLVNPWVRTAQGEARTALRRYYPRRLLSRSFWTKLLSGRLRIREAVSRLVDSFRKARADGAAAPDADLARRMAVGLRESGRPFSLILSELDAVANEFEDEALATAAWRDLCASQMVFRHTIPGAGHTLAETDSLPEAVDRTLHALDSASSGATLPSTADARSPGGGTRS